MRNVVRYQQQWPGQSMLQDEIKQVFDRFFQAGYDQDESSVVTSQWVPLVDIVVMITIPKRPETKPRRIQVDNHQGDNGGARQ